MADRKLKMGMVGGGIGAFIGDVHRRAAGLDGQIELVAGAFDIDPEKSKQVGKELFLDASRVYGTYQEMIEKEKQLPAGQRIDFVSVCTPNHTHFPIARDFLKAGFNVMCEKPMTVSVEEAQQLADLVEQTGLVFALMHNYTGYPMVKLARDMVKAGDLGKIRKIVVQYPQGWLATALENEGNMQASWRTDPAKSGGSGCGGDIGSHAENLAEYITGLKITHLCAQLSIMVPGRKVDDDVNCLLKFDNGAAGVLHASQISVGEENNLAIWVYGEKGGLEWHQEYPNDLLVKSGDGAEQKWRRGNPYVAQKSPAAARAMRIPPGHPEAFFEAMANIYKNFVDTIRAKAQGTQPDAIVADFPDVRDGLRGMQFLNTLLESAKSQSKWTELK